MNINLHKIFDSRENQKCFDELKELVKTKYWSKILDRLLHHLHVINITGNSYRIKDKIEHLDGNKKE